MPFSCGIGAHVLRDEAQELLIAQSNIGSIYDFAGGKLLRQEKEEQKR